MKLKLQYCPQAEQEHIRSKRQYAHTFHYKNTVCVNNALWNLPVNLQYGILLHEIGHILVGTDFDNSIRDVIEKLADDIIWDVYGIKIYRIDSKEYGRNIEWIGNSDINEAEEIFRDVFK